MLTDPEVESEAELQDAFLETYAEGWGINYRRDARQGYPKLLQAAQENQKTLLLDSVVRAVLGGFVRKPASFFSKIKAPLHQRVAARNDPYARYFLATQIPLGEERRSELLRAGEDGCPYAYYQLACEAQGTEQADSIPDWLRKGAENGCPVAQYEYALLLEETEMKQATVYLEKAADTEREAALELLRLVIEGKTQTEKQEELLHTASSLGDSGDKEAAALVEQAIERGLLPPAATDDSERRALTAEELASASPEQIAYMLTDESQAYFIDTQEQLYDEYFGPGVEVCLDDLFARLSSLPEAEQDGRILSMLGFCQISGGGCRKNTKQGLATLMNAVRRYKHLPSAIFVLLLYLQGNSAMRVSDDMASECLITAALLGHPIAKAMLGFSGGLFQS